MALVLDHYSRRALGFTVFFRQPTSRQVRHFLGGVIGRAGKAPKHLVTDSGVQFTCDDFKRWCGCHSIHQRKGAVGKPGSIAVIERFIGTLKREGIQPLPLISLFRRAFYREVLLNVGWYNSFRPHMSLQGAAPDEVYFARSPASRKPRFEPRAAWPRASPCAAPLALIKGQPGTHIQLKIQFVAGRRHLPRITLTRAA